MLHATAPVIAFHVASLRLRSRQDMAEIVLASGYARGCGAGYGLGLGVGVGLRWVVDGRA